MQFVYLQLHEKSSDIWIFIETIISILSCQILFFFFFFFFLHTIDTNKFSMINLKIHNFFLQEIVSTQADRLVREEIHNTDTEVIEIWNGKFIQFRQAANSACYN